MLAAAPPNRTELSFATVWRFGRPVAILSLRLSGRRSTRKPAADSLLRPPEQSPPRTGRYDRRLCLWPSWRPNTTALPRPDSSVVERGPEKAGVGGSIPSLATTFLEQAPTRLNSYPPEPTSPHTRSRSRPAARPISPILVNPLWPLINSQQQQTKPLMPSKIIGALTLSNLLYC
jgi:hypothetical protein